ncbi:WD40-repeat-containing domain protein [Mycena vulgaris]|nr:WD40-repeat-containing domain protein [Mycena vulgaris]
MKGHSNSVNDVAFSPDGTGVMKMEGHTDQVLSVAFSPDGAGIMSGSDDMTVRIWDATTGAKAP